jgi:peptide/nickel transport system ATP-binding protein
VAELCDAVCVIYAGQTVESGPVDAVLKAPSHPYTRALLACHPERAISFVGIPGTVPSPLRMPSGCRFAPRCHYVEPVCSTVLPNQTSRSSGTEVRCIHPA